AVQLPARYASLSTKYASSEVAALRESEEMRALKPRARYAAYCGIAIAARMPTMATTTRSSMSVKPFDFFRFILEPLLILASSLWLDGCRARSVGFSRSKAGATGRHRFVRTHSRFCRRERRENAGPR